mmetsp:Transcript_24666/g.71232  ORF Transcript_24666/g.71232 Transcript_24666/m.71232 type:complete len:93 (-) Transcript_24666:1732-2010(-)
MHSLRVTRHTDKPHQANLDRCVVDPGLLGWGRERCVPHTQRGCTDSATHEHQQHQSHRIGMYVLPHTHLFAKMSWACRVRPISRFHPSAATS